MRRLDSLIIKCHNNTVPASHAGRWTGGLARQVTRMIEENHNIEVIRQEVTEFPVGLPIIATGPLTSDGLAKAHSKSTGL